jgi:recombination protein RecR
MFTSSQSLTLLIAQFARLPGIGKKTAQRLAFHILRVPREEALALASAIEAVRERIRACSECGNFTEEETCSVCRDPARDNGIVCVVEQPTDLLALEATGEFRGRYHVLHGALSPLEGARPETLRLDHLVERLRRRPAREVIIATNPTVEGDATAFYIARLVRPLGARVSRIARGVPVGGDLEFSDQVTLARAIAGRVDLD